MKTKYEEILEREFRRVLSLTPEIVVKPIFGLEAGGESSNEIIHCVVVHPINGIQLYTMFIGSDDDEFVFINQETGDVTTFPFPDDYIEMEETGEEES
jgi:hypothetical protein